MDNDQSKAKTFQKLFPKERILNFISSFEHGFYFVDMLTDYDRYNDNFLITFDNQNINSAFRRFDKAFLELKTYLVGRAIDPKRAGMTDPDMIPLGSTDAKLYELVEILKREYVDFIDTISRELNNGQTKKGNISETFEISVKDREIWINNYILSRPLSTGVNYEFFEYVRSKPANTKIERTKLPEQSQELSLKGKVRNKTFSKILNELGFKGQILKAFFYKRKANSFYYIGDKITEENLKNSGVKIKAFIIELELANAKNSKE